MATQPSATAAIEAHAMAKHVRMSPQKVRLVVDLIRGQKAEYALQILRWTRKRPAPMGRAFRYQKRTSHIVVAVAEHHLAAQERAAAAAAEAEAHKGVKGVVKKDRRALAGKKPSTKKSKK